MEKHAFEFWAQTLVTAFLKISDYFDSDAKLKTIDYPFDCSPQEKSSRLKP